MIAPRLRSAFGSLALISLAAGCGSSGSDVGNDGAAQTDNTPSPDAVDTSGGMPALPSTPPPTGGGVPGGIPQGEPGEGAFLDDPNAEPMITPAELTDQNACAGLELIPEEVVVEVPMEITTTTEVIQPVAFYIVLDNSLSMNNALPGFEGTQGGGNGFPGNDGFGNDDEEEDVAPDDGIAEAQVGAGGAAGGASAAAGAPAAGGAAVDPAPAEPAPTATNRWELAVQSLTEFVTNPASEGLDVAIQYFNPAGLGDQRATEGPLCDGSAHGDPDVVMGRLPDNRQALVDSLERAQPRGYTPTVGALRGGIAYCQEFEAENPDEDCVVVLVTDGVPWGCGLGAAADVYDPASMDVLVPIAEAGNAAGVNTYTVAMDGVLADGFLLLDAIAAAGGTDCTPGDVGGESCNVSSTGSQGLVETLNAIRDTVTVTETVTEVTTVIEQQKLDCQWVIPEPPEEETLDPKRVNVTLALDGAEPDFIASVANEAECAATGGIGWYYDNPDAPTMIFACSESCSQIQNGVNPAVNVLLGCETIVTQVMR